MLSLSFGEVGSEEKVHKDVHFCLANTNSSIFVASLHDLSEKLEYVYFIYLCKAS